MKREIYTTVIPHSRRLISFNNVNLDLRSWMEEHVGQEAIRLSSLMRFPFYDWHFDTMTSPDGIIFSFADQDKAILFKLMWA